MSSSLMAAGVLLAGAVSAGYFALHRGCDSILAPALPHAEVAHTTTETAMMALLVLLFAGLLVLQSQLPQWTSSAWCRSLYVHARNGFYINTLANRAIQKVWPST